MRLETTAINNQEGRKSLDSALCSQDNLIINYGNSNVRRFKNNNQTLYSNHTLLITN